LRIDAPFALDERTLSGSTTSTAACCGRSPSP
jgi:hypothetical protein